MRRRLEQVVDLEADRLAQRLDRPPALGDFLEPLDHLVDAEPALNLELAVAAGACSIDAAGRDIGAKDVDGPTAPLFGILGEQHRQRINLLPGRTASRPDPQALALGAPG